MARKTYEIQGKQFTLAPCTTERLKRFVAFSGINDFGELKKTETLEDLGVKLLNAGLDEEVKKELLSMALLESIDEIDLAELDLTVMDEAFRDFFMQRLGK